MHKKRNGFTLLETVISLSFVTVFILLVIYVPTHLASVYKALDEKVAYTESVIAVYQSFSKDISAENGSTIINDNELTIGKSKYIFSENGLSRRASTNLKVTDIPVSYVIDNHQLIVDIPNENGTYISFKYYLNFSSFPNGGETDE